jgi:hypothetical protein
VPGLIQEVFVFVFLERLVKKSFPCLHPNNALKEKSDPAFSSLAVEVRTLFTHFFYLIFFPQEDMCTEVRPGGHEPGPLPVRDYLWR